ncbi:transposase, mutator type [Artemisia annua]|uniref:Transposase, mutator type n=1 Tax=Artemisia annua TaxID=35608 RepID=A0A2U1MYY8_ARTAN|nr:transposase, mutator type [Artemisia annua]
MVVYEWHIRDYDDEVNEVNAYLIELNEMVKQIGYKRSKVMYYHFKIPNSNLDFGLQALGNDQDVLNLLKYTDKYKLIEVYIEHDSTDLETYMKSPRSLVIEELPDEQKTKLVKKKAPKKRNRLPLLLTMGDGSDEEDNGVGNVNVIGQGGDVGNDLLRQAMDEEFDPFFGEQNGPNIAPTTTPTRNETFVEVEHDEEYDIDNDLEVSSDSDKESDENDSDFVDDEHVLNEVDVDMKDFYENIDKDVEWIGCSNGNAEIPAEVNVEEGYDIDYFDSASDSEELEGARNKALRDLKKEHEKQDNVDNIAPFFVGKLFPEKDSVRKLVYAHAVAIRRQLYIWKNDTERIRVVCREKSTEKRSTSRATAHGGDFNKVGVKTIKVGGTKGQYKYEEITCPWVLHISKSKEQESWRVKTLKPEVPIRALKDQLQKKYQLGISDNRIYRAKAKATMKVKGDYTQQYAILRDYVLELQRTNRDTTVKLDVERGDPSEPTRQFRRIYICLGALKKGFKAGQKELLGLDGCFMKGQYPGQLPTAVGIDPNHGTYPLAYAIVEAETLNSWSWFLTTLGDDLDLTRESHFTFMSDRQKGIIPAIARVFPSAEHRYRVRHIYENMKLQWKGELFKELIWKCASATTIPYFDKAMDELRKADEKAYEWLKKIPPQHWSRSHFSGRANCDMLLNNICEVFNRQLVDGRDVSIITCLEFVREYLMKRIVNVQKVIDKSKGPLTPSATVLFNAIKEKASLYKVLWNGENEYQVTGPWDDQVVVDVMKKNCSCRKWELTGMPCKHVVAALWDRAGHKDDGGIPENWVHPSYWLATWKKVYSYKIYCLNGPDLWKKHPCPNTLIPPKHHTQIGRPPKKRKKSAHELSSQKMSSGGKLSRVGKTVTCTFCKTLGHTKRSCKVKVGGYQPMGASAANTGRSSQKSATTSTKASQRSASTPTRASQKSASTLTRASQRKNVEHLQSLHNNKKDDLDLLVSMKYELLLDGHKNNF